MMVARGQLASERFLGAGFWRAVVAAAVASDMMRSCSWLQPVPPTSCILGKEGGRCCLQAA